MVCGFSETKNNSYRIWNPKTRRVVERWNVVFIETPPNLLPVARRLSPQQDLKSPSYDFSDDTLDNNYLSLDDMLRDVQNYTLTLDFGVDTPAGTVELLLPQQVSPGVTLPGRALPTGVSPGGVTPEGSSPSPASAPAPGPAPAPASAASRATNGRANRGTVGATPTVTRSRAASILPVPVATRYGGGRNSNRATLAELFEVGTLQRVSELELGPPCYTEDIAHQAENTRIIIEYAYVATNALGSIFGREDQKPIPNTFKDAMTFPQAAHWKVASAKEIASLEKYGVYELVPITSFPNGRKVVSTRWINQKDYTKDIVQSYGMRGCNPAYTPGVGPELSIDQPEENLLNEEGKRRYQSIADAAMYLEQVCRYDILYIVNQLARAMSKPSKAHMGAAKHLLCYLAWSIDFSIACKQGSFKLATFSDANWGANPDNGKSTSSNIIMLSKGPISFKVGIQEFSAHGGGIGGDGARHEGSSLLQQHDAQARLQGRVRQCAALHRKHMLLHDAGNRTYSPRAKHIALRYFFVEELVEEGKMTIRFVKTEKQIADVGTKHANKHRHRALIKLNREFEA